VSHMSDVGYGHARTCPKHKTHALDMSYLFDYKKTVFTAIFSLSVVWKMLLLSLIVQVKGKIEI
jgi:hypothetical protein